jgi:DNA-binding response OmpR family regulator
VTSAVLVVDDAPALAAACAQSLAEAGYEARATSALDARCG